SKFLERHQSLVTALLDLRFDNQASAQGLAAFLGSQDGGEHWLRLVPLAPGLLPFEQIRVRTRELAHTPLPGTRLLLVENERCVHLLPPLADTVAVLGSGLDLGWLQAPWLRDRAVGYWGDMDSWGLLMLGRARLYLPGLQRVLMERSMFDRYCAALAVKEPVPTDSTPPPGLDEEERAFHHHLLLQPKGRIEQELLPRDDVMPALHAWWAATERARGAR
ncbi:Wadjet anti-phage system protein JetD domain-containing protein, partial [Stenotrophomonas sp. NPDC077659]|uniref:Wadjet anti-phage system protein JetD domain-containing protein n=1 Tax=Stenotrophomonas sp. NPDC077659 TaxID=3390694 RepID=UPI003D040B61